MLGAVPPVPFRLHGVAFGTEFLYNIYAVYSYIMGTAVAQWLRCCATNRKIAGSIPVGVIGVFH